MDRATHRLFTRLNQLHDWYLEPLKEVHEETRKNYMALKPDQRRVYKEKYLKKQSRYEVLHDIYFTLYTMAEEYEQLLKERDARTKS